jgi:hypothetical protein
MPARKRSGRTGGKTCKEITDLVLDYFNERLNAEEKREFKQHLRICPDCVSFLNTYKKTVSVTRSLDSDEIPGGVRENILQFLRKRARKRGSRF